MFSETGDAERFREGHSNGESILRSTATYTYSKALTFEAGGEGDYNFLFSHTTYVVNGDLQDLPAADVHVSELRGELFGKATWIINPKFTLEAGLRLEGSHIASTGDVVLGKTLVYPKPRAVLTWSPDAADQFRFRVEKEVSQLDFNAFVAAPALTTGQVYVGNPNLVPQQFHGAGGDLRAAVPEDRRRHLHLPPLPIDRRDRPRPGDQPYRRLR